MRQKRRPNWFSRWEGIGRARRGRLQEKQLERLQAPRTEQSSQETAAQRAPAASSSGSGSGSGSGSASFTPTVSDGVLRTSTSLVGAVSASIASPEQYVVIHDSNPLLTAEAQNLWEQALSSATRHLADLLSNPFREDILTDVFGRAGTDPATFEANKQTLLDILASTGLRIEVELRSDAELNGALAAYAAVGHTGTERIYVNGDKLNNGQLDLTLTTKALLEEFGHAIDRRLNGGVDSRGDEGQLFAAEVSGVVLTADQRALIDAEDDSAVLMIGGVEVGVEQAQLSSITALTFSDDNGSSSTDLITNSNTQYLNFTYNWSWNGSNSFDIYVDTGNGSRVLLLTQDDPGNGNTSVNTPVTVKGPVTLVSGTNTLGFYTASTGGNPISSFTYTLDTTSASSLSARTLDLTAATDSGTSNTDNNTNDTTPDITVSTLNGVAMSVGDVIQIIDTSNSNAVVGSYTVVSGDLTSGNWNGTTKNITLSTALSDGLHNLAVRLADLAGNTGTQSTATLAVTIDTTAPSSLSARTLDLTAATDSGTSNTDNNTNDTTPDITVSTLNGVAMSVGDVIQIIDTSNSNAVVGSYTVVSGDLTSGNWNGTTKNITLSTALSDGLHNLAVRLADLAGNTGTQSTATLAVTIDATAPSSLSARTLDLTSATDSGTSNTDNTTNDSTPDITVSTLNGVTMSVGDVIQIIDTSNSNVVVGSYTVVSGDLTTGAWNGTTKTITLSTALSDGLHNLAVRLSDLAGNTGTQSTATLGVTIDTAAPAAPSFSLATDSGSSSSDGVTNVGTVNVSGVETNATWAYTTNGNAGTPTWTTGSGSSFTLAAGTYAIGAVRVRQTDLAGNVTGTASQNAAAITVDATAPSSLSARTLDLTSATDSGTSNTDNTTNDSTPDITVSTLNGVTMSVGDVIQIIDTSNSNVVVGSYTVVSGDLTTGAWNGTTKTITLSTALSDGLHNLAVRLSDLAGNAGTRSTATLGVTIDTTAPSSLSARTLDLTSATDSGTSNTDNTTNDSTPDITVSTLNGVTMSVGDVIQIIDTSNSNVVVGSYTVVSGDLTTGAWNGTTKTITLSTALSDGLHNLAVRLSDLAGNTGTQSTATLGVTIDTAAPAAPSFSLATDSGSSSSDGVTNVGTVNVSGVETNATWEYSINSGTAWTTGSGSSFTLAAGTYAIGAVRVRQTDLAGNVTGTASQNAAAITVDATAPSSLSARTLDLTSATDSGTSNTDNTTNDSTPDITVSTLNGVTMSVGDVIQIIDTSNSNVVVGSYTVVSGDLTTGAWNGTTKTITLSTALSDGLHNLAVRLSDLAGNTGTQSTATLGVTIDTAAPAAPSFSLATDSGSSSSDGVTNVGTVNVSGVETNATWEYSINSGTAWTTGSGSSFTLAAGTYAIGAVRVRQTDLAGNVTGTASQNAAAITVDATAPAAPSFSLATDSGSSSSDGVTNVGTVNVSGVETNATWEYSINSGTAWTTGSGSSFTLAAGTYAIGAVRVRQTDLAGNVTGTASQNPAAITVDATAPAAPSFSLATDSGSSSSDGVTNVGTVNVSGVETNATWEYSINSGTAWTTGSGSSFTLAAGTYAIGAVRVRQTDLAGNVTGTASQNPAAITVDATAPAAPTFSLATDSGSSSSDGVTNVGTINVTGVESNASWEYSTNSGTSWSTGSGSSFTLAAGTYAIGAVRVRQTDLAGNVTATPSSNSAAITVDATAPAAPTFSLATDSGSSSSDGVTNVGTINVSGVESNASWEYSTNSGTSWSTGSGSSFTLAAGTYAIGAVRVRQTDLAGNVTVTPSQNAAAITVDATAPAAPTFSLATDSGSSSSDGVTNVGTINVTGVESNASWEYSTNSGTSWSTGSGSSFTLAAGTYAIGAVRVRQTDLAGNVTGTASQNPAAITVDATAPAAPTFSLATDSGSSSSDGVTNVGTINVTGVESNASWEYSTNSGTSWSTGSGSSFTLAAGTYAIGAVRVRQTDLAGNVTATPSSNSAAITVDATAPAAPTFSLATDSGSSSSDGVTNVGTINVSGVESNASWEYSTNSGTSWSTGSGSSFTLAAGTYAIGAVRVRQTDLAGNVSATPSQNAAAITVDATAPAAPSITSITDDIAPVTGTVSNGGSTNDTVLLLNGSAEANSTIQLFNGATSIGSTTTNGAGAWTFTTATLSNDTRYSFTATATDGAGNVSAASSPYVINVDTGPPAALTLTLGSGLSDGATAAEATAATGAVSVVAQAGTNVTVSFSRSQGGSVTKNLIGSGAAQAVVLSTADLATLGDGVINVSAVASDGAGNSSDPATATFTLDTTAPQPLALTLQADTGSSSKDGITANPQVLVSQLDSGSVWEVSTNAGSSWTTGSGNSFNLSEGSYATNQVQVRQRDTAGNISTATGNSTAWLVDTTAPQFIAGSSAAATPILENSGSKRTIYTPQMAATEAATGGVLRYSLLSGGDASNFSVGTFSGAVTLLSNPNYEIKSSYAFTLRATDVAGNATDQMVSLQVLDVDEVAPNAPQIAVVGSDDQLNGAEASSSVVISGTAEAGSLVTVRWGNNPARTATATGGSWSVTYSPSEIPANGTSLISATAKDLAGNLSSTGSRSVLVDRIAPNRPLLNTVAGDNRINASEWASGIQLQGTAELGSSVTANLAGVIRSTTVDANGNWLLSYASAALPADGLASLTVTSSDPAGNISTAATRLLQVDTAAPLVPTLQAVAGDNRINAAEAGGGIQLNGSAEAGSTIQALWAGNSVGSAVASSAGIWAINVAAAALPADGTRNLVISSRDAAGNTNTNLSRDIVLDRLAPGAPVIGGIGNNDVVNALTAANGVAVSGTAEAGSLVQLQWGDLIRSVAAGSDGAWSLIYNASQLPIDGKHSLSARAIDASGNVSGAGNRAVLIDTTASSTQITALQLSADTGTSANDFVTSEAKQTLSGTLSAALQSGETVQVSLDGGSSWTKGEVGGDQRSFSAPLSLGTGKTAGSIQVMVMDAAGNAGAIRSQGYRLEAAGNGNGVASLAISADSGTVGDLLTNVSLQSIGGELVAPLLAGERVQFRALLSNSEWSSWGTASSSTNSTSFTFLNTLREGINQLEVRHLDSAGNPSEISSLGPVLDSTAPQVSGITLNGAGLDRPWQAGDLATIQVVFSEAVNVNGTPALQLSISDRTVATTYSGDKAAELQFTYTLTSADTANGSPVISITPGSLDLTNASVTDAAGNNALSVINNQVFGSGSSDAISGTTQIDVITGAAGADQLSGGLSSDLFIFRSGSDSCLGTNNSSFDTITDFQLGIDQLQLGSLAPVSSFKPLGSTSELTSSALGSLLNPTDFQAVGFGAQFSVGTNNFLAVNDANAGFSELDDLVVMLSSQTTSLS